MEEFSERPSRESVTEDRQMNDEIDRLSKLYNQTFVPNKSWLAPTSVLTPRFVKISATIDF